MKLMVMTERKCGNMNRDSEDAQTHTILDTVSHENSTENGGSSQLHVRVSVSSEMTAGRRREVSYGNVGRKLF